MMTDFFDVNVPFEDLSNFEHDPILDPSKTL